MNGLPYTFYQHSFKWIIWACLWILTQAISLSGVAQIKTFATPGAIVDTIYCHANPDQSYALFLPSNYRDQQKWPIIYFFEPAARGTLPLLHFKKAAEQYGYILVASNNSKNGSWEVVFTAAKAMFRDTGNRFSIDSNRVYTAGFSGGARAAAAIATEYGYVTGVIACGAGLPNLVKYRPDPLSTYAYLGMVGDKDMNFRELHTVKGLLDSMKIRNRLLVFHGGHQWPPEQTAIEAIRWLEVTAMHDGIKHEDSLKFYFNRRIEVARDLKKAGALYQAAMSYNQTIQDFDDLLDTTPAQKELGLITEYPTYKRDLKLNKKRIKKEKLLIDRYLHAFRGISKGNTRDTVYFKNAQWWVNERKYLIRLSESKDQSERLLANRMLDFIWRRCAETGINYYVKGDYQRAIMIDEVWAQIQPMAKYPQFRLARSYARLGSPEMALQHLLLAVEYGINDFDLLNEEKAFVGLHHNQTYQNLLNSLR